MDAVVELYNSLPGIIGAAFWGILMLYWFTDFFGFLRELFTNSSKKVELLEERIQLLEGQLTELKLASQDDATKLISQAEPADPQTILAV